MKWIDPRFAGTAIVEGALVRLPPLKIAPIGYAVHNNPPTKRGRRAGEPRSTHRVPIYALVPKRCGKLYSYAGRN